MHRIGKLIGILFILGFVFFIICDERGIDIKLEENHIVFHKTGKEPNVIADTQKIIDPNAVYKNSNLIHINYEFENPKTLRKSDGVDRKYIAKLEKEKKLEEEKIREQENLRKHTFEDGTILSAFQGSGENTGTINKEMKQDTGTVNKEVKQGTGTVNQGAKQNTGTVKKETKQRTRTAKKETSQNTGTEKQKIKNSTGKISDSTNKTGIDSEPEYVRPIIYYPIKKYEHSNHTLTLSKGAEIPKVKIERYSGKKSVAINLKKGKEPGPLYKNSNRIKIYSGFENIVALRNSAGIDEEFLLRQKNSRPTIISLNDDDTISSARQNIHENGDESIDSGYNIEDNDNSTGKDENGISNTGINDSEINIKNIHEKYDVEIHRNEDSKNEDLESDDSSLEIIELGRDIETGTNETEIVDEAKQIITYKVNKYEPKNHSIILNKGKEPEIFLVKIEKYQPETHTVNIKKGYVLEDVKEDNSNIDSYDTLNKGEESEPDLVKIEKYKPESHISSIKKGYIEEKVEEGIDENTKEEIDENTEEEINENTEKEDIENIGEDSIDSYDKYVTVERPILSKHSAITRKGKEPEIVLVKIEKYQLIRHSINLKRGKSIEYDFVVENTETIEQNEDGLSDVILEELLGNEEIDINTLESENDEFLQKVFEQTKDTDVMNLIVETYLNEYQFVKAKRFIEDLPDEYKSSLKPSLNLRVAFNSFSLSSKTIDENLIAIVQDYSSKNEISDEDKNRYLGVIALMNRNYDRFFEISTGFTSEKNISFTSKLQGYKNQISTQMGMPDYYFDTLVSLELFNQGLFQPAKVLSLYSLQENPDYILPYQVLAYANFLTNSRDTSSEYLKKLMDLDPNNADKYRFLMGVASYWDEKYEQSVVMLSMIKDESLRLDTQRYLINDYIKLDQKNKLISVWNKLLGYENLVSSDFYTYFYEAFFHPYSEGAQFQIYAYDTELAGNMLRACSVTLQNEEKAVCTYGTIGRNIALGQFDGLEQYLLNLATEYPQGYLYQALGDYYIQQGDLEKAKAYLIKAISLTQKKSERSQIKKLLQDTM